MNVGCWVGLSRKGEEEEEEEKKRIWVYGQDLNAHNLQASKQNIDTVFQPISKPIFSSTKVR